MKKITVLIILILFTACNKTLKNSIELKSNKTTWVAYKGFYFNQELITCGGDSNTDIIIDIPINENDKIVKKEDNKFYYSTIAKEQGQFTISGRIITGDKTQKFTQTIFVLPMVDPIAYNVENAYSLKVRTKNEVFIKTYIMERHQQLNCSNGTIITENGKTYITPETIGRCIIKIKGTLPDGEIVHFEDIIFNVTE